MNEGHKNANDPLDVMCSTRSALMIKVHPWHRWTSFALKPAAPWLSAEQQFEADRAFLKSSKMKMKKKKEMKEKVGSPQVCFGPPSSLETHQLWLFRGLATCP